MDAICPIQPPEPDAVESFESFAADTAPPPEVIRESQAVVEIDDDRRRSVRNVLNMFRLDESRRPITIAPWRSALARKVLHPYFERFTATLIICNCAFLAVSDPSAPNNSERNLIVQRAEYFFLACFILEMTVKIVILGPLTRRIGYFRDNWNILDFVVVAAALAGVIVETTADNNNTSGLSALRAFRLLRPMRALTSIPQIKIIVNSVVQSLPALGNVMVLYLFFLIMFGILGVQLFKERLAYRCFQDGETTPVLPGTQVCTSGPNVEYGYHCPWNTSCQLYQNPDRGYTSFDNIGSAAFVIFISVSLEGWSAFMYSVMHATNPYSSIYFIFIILIGNIFIINMTLVIINFEFTLNVEKERQRALQNLEQHEEAFNGTPIVMVLSPTPKEELQQTVSLDEVPATKWDTFRVNVRDMMRHKITIGVLTCSILGNTAIMSAEHHDQPPGLGQAIDISNTVFTVVFTIEIFGNVIAFWYKDFVADKFHIFDSVVIFMSWVDIIFLADVDTGISVMRGFRLLRMFKVAKHWPTLQLWVDIIVNSVQGASLLTALLGLLIFVYALIGLEFFGDGLCVERSAVTGNCTFEPRENFNTFGYSVLTVFQVLTGENWNAVMYTVMATHGEATMLYFSSLFILGTYLVLNLFISVLLTSRPIIDAEDDDVSLMILQRRRSSVVKSGGSRSLFFLTADNPFRIALMRILNHNLFEAFVILLIIASCVTLAIEDPSVAPDEPLVNILFMANSILSGLFVLEAILKIIGFGFVLHPGSYLRDSWNALDFLIAIIGLITIIIDNPKLNVLKAFRALRPLRFINKSQGMKVAVKALLHSLKPLGGVSSVCFLIWLVFAIMGVQFFKGSFYTCTTNLTIQTKNECLATGNAWETPATNFDNVLSGMLSLFVITTLEGWVDVMQMGMDAVDPDHARSTNHQPWVAVYFLVFVVVGSFFTVNLFLAVLLDNFDRENELQHEEDELLLRRGMRLTTDQNQWLHLQGVILKNTARDTTIVLTPMQKHIHNVITDDRFEYVVSVVIVLNVGFMATEHAHQSENWETFLLNADIAFISIFVFEAAIKLAGFGVRGYFKSQWNRFDFAILLISLGGLIASLAAGVDMNVVMMFRILRLARLMRVIKIANRIRILLNALLISIPQMSNIVGLLGLVIFVYSVIGVSIFGRLARTLELNSIANFQTFGNAFLLLIRMTTGESWNLVMAACMVAPPWCELHLGECGWPVFAPFYFVSFTIVCMYILMNLFIAVIVNSFNDTTDEEKSLITVDYLATIQLQWSRLDPTQTHIIPTVLLPQFLREIGPPLGWKKGMTRIEQWTFFKTVAPHLEEIYSVCGAPTADGVVHYRDVVLGLLRCYINVVDLPPSTQRPLTLQWEELYPELFNEGTMRRPSVTTFAAMKIQGTWKTFMGRRRRAAIREIKLRGGTPSPPPSPWMRFKGKLRGVGRGPKNHEIEKFEKEAPPELKLRVPSCREMEVPSPRARNDQEVIAHDID